MLLDDVKLCVLGGSVTVEDSVECVLGVVFKWEGVGVVSKVNSKSLLENSVASKLHVGDNAVSKSVFGVSVESKFVLEFVMEE